MLGAAPAQAFYFGGYEVGRQLVPPGTGVAGDMAVGCIAQVIAGTAFTPVDIVKERLQVRPRSPPRLRGPTPVWSPTASMRLSCAGACDSQG